MSFASIALGIGEIVGVLCFGYLQDNFSVKTTVYLNLVSLVIAGFAIVGYA
jgi:MFS-type transporter involved in bile tolerance (Atg22 family)